MAWGVGLVGCAARHLFWTKNLFLGHKCPQIPTSTTSHPITDADKGWVGAMVLMEQKNNREGLFVDLASWQAWLVHPVVTCVRAPNTHSWESSHTHQPDPTFFGQAVYLDLAGDACLVFVRKNSRQRLISGKIRIFEIWNFVWTYRPQFLAWWGLSGKNPDPILRSFRGICFCPIWASLVVRQCYGLIFFQAMKPKKYFAVFFFVRYVIKK